MLRSAKYAVLMIALGAGVGFVPGVEEKFVRQAVPIRTTLCALRDHPASYKGKVVEIRVRINVGFEYSNIGDVRCARSGTALSIDPKSDTKALVALLDSYQEKVVVATITGKLLTDGASASGWDMFVLSSARDFVVKAGEACPWMTPPSPFKFTKGGEPDRKSQWASDPCSPDNWLRTHPGYRE